MLRQAQHERKISDGLNTVIPFALSPSAALRTGLSKGDHEDSRGWLEIGATFAD
jgi:hypothetical protein